MRFLKATRIRCYVLFIIGLILVLSLMNHNQLSWPANQVKLNARNTFIQQSEENTIDWVKGTTQRTLQDVLRETTSGENSKSIQVKTAIIIKSADKVHDIPDNLNLDKIENVTNLMINVSSNYSFTKAPVLRTYPNRRTQLSHGLNYPLMVDLRGLIHRKLTLGQEITEKPINPHPFAYVHRTPDCKFEEEIRGLIILVKSTAKNFNLRRGIRDTWGNARDISNVRIVFMLGFDPDNSTQWIVHKEVEQYNDIIQENFTDNYHNNTFKTIMGFNWAVKFCSSATFLFFVDDDYLILLPNLINHIDSIHPSLIPKIFQGHLVPHSRPFDDKHSKWFVSVMEYPHDFYPPYLAGGAYLVSMEVAIRFYLAFPYVRYLKIDDSYLGIVAKKLSIRPSSFYQFFMHRARVVENKLPMFIASHGFKNPEVLLKTWRPLHNAVASKLLKPRKRFPMNNTNELTH